MPDPFYGHQPSVGLHILKDAWCQKAYLGVQSRRLAEPGELSNAIAATFAAAPVRHQGYRLERSPAEAIHVSEQERRLEAALLQRWGSPGMWPTSGGWGRLVACQVPLFDQAVRAGWGYIDLLGVTAEGLPAVVELKKAPTALADGQTAATETPFRMVLEAAAYAVALRRNWEIFRPEWIARLNTIGLPDSVIAQVPLKLERVPLVAVAPASFWIDWLPVTAKGQTVTDETWESFRLLMSEFEKENLPVSFFSVSGHDLDPDGLAIQPLIGFPPCTR
ncbi:hypothetical protein [Planctomicrobium piriforme]|uniref:Uncharacterized protein n=1 Tax=Planctomicrobium piriforme TaxID=1576369 RepID=A0A1I3SK25_9PLAN|nr:hypothetical protein [Planctomicrobium piriforme]SFJ58482.1 hypothetical protein SAMN05421753_12445 [Planctomicrobium piriforme]